MPIDLLRDLEGPQELDPPRLQTPASQRHRGFQVHGRGARGHRPGLHDRRLLGLHFDRAQAGHILWVPDGVSLRNRRRRRGRDDRPDWPSLKNKHGPAPDYGRLPRRRAGQHSGPRRQVLHAVRRRPHLQQRQSDYRSRDTSLTRGTPPFTLTAMASPALAHGMCRVAATRRPS